MNVSVYLSDREAKILDKLRRQKSRSSYIKSVVFKFTPSEKKRLEARVAIVEELIAEQGALISDLIGTPEEFAGPSV